MAQGKVYPTALAEFIISGPRHAVPVVSQAASRKILTTECELMGWSLVEVTGTGAAEVWLYDGQDTTGSLVATISLAQSEADTMDLGLLGVACRGGLYLYVVQGEVSGAVWVRR